MTWNGNIFLYISGRTKSLEIKNWFCLWAYRASPLVRWWPYTPCHCSRTELGVTGGKNEMWDRMGHQKAKITFYWICLTGLLTWKNIHNRLRLPEIHASAPAFSAGDKYGIVLSTPLQGQGCGKESGEGSLPIICSLQTAWASMSNPEARWG